MNSTLYTILTSNDGTHLASKVQEKLDDGWELYGNPYTTCYTTTCYHHQAVIKKQTPPPVRGLPR